MDRKAILEKLFAENRIADLFILARYMYSISKDLVNDETYTMLEGYCKEENLAEEYLARTYDDDPIPYHLLQEFGISADIAQLSSERQQYYEMLSEDRTLSITSLIDYFQAFNFFRNVAKQRLVVSLKVNGINTKTLYCNRQPDISELVLSLSRGRSGKPFDLTDNILLKYPRYCTTDVPEFVVVGEAFVNTEALSYLENKYNKDYKMERGAANSMLRVKHDDADYKHLRILTFGAEGLADTQTGTLKALESMGFETVPYFVVEPEEIPATFDDFCVWLKTVFDKMYVLGEGIPSDGVVVSVDNFLFEEEIKNQYSNRNCALKFEYWSHVYYKAIVEDILIEQQAVDGSCRVRIKPLIAKDRSEAKVINMFNPGILVQEGVVIGSEVFFERNSGAYNTLLYGEKLKKLHLGNL